MDNLKIYVKKIQFLHEDKSFIPELLKNCTHLSGTAIQNMWLIYVLPFALYHLHDKLKK